VLAGDLPTNGILNAVVVNPRIHRKFNVSFYIAVNHRQSIFAIDACLDFELLPIVQENLCAIQQTQTARRSLPMVTVKREFVMHEYKVKVKDEHF